MTKKQMTLEQRWATDNFNSSTYEPPKQTIDEVDSETKTTKAANSPQAQARALVKARLDEAKRLAETVIKPRGKEEGESATQKHLQGRHNQRNHGNRKGRLAIGSDKYNASLSQPAKKQLSAEQARNQILGLEKQRQNELLAIEAEKEKLSKLYDEIERPPFGESWSPGMREKADGIMEKMSEKSTEIFHKKRELEGGMVEAARKLVMVDNPSNLSGNKDFDFEFDSLDNGINAFNQLVDRSVMPDKKPELSTTFSGRAYFDGENKITIAIMGSGERAVIHELGHWLERHNQKIGDSALAFLEKRTANEQLVSLRSIDSTYDIREFTKKDKFIDPYMGKDYGGKATEIFSLGLQMFYENPMKLAREDPEYFDFIYNSVRGN